MPKHMVLIMMLFQKLYKGLTLYLVNLLNHKKQTNQAEVRSELSQATKIELLA